MLDKLILHLKSDVPDTVANYVKDDLGLRGFFCRKRKKRRENSFAIQAAENEGMPEPPDETR